jgi:hypothetical protein
MHLSRRFIQKHRNKILFLFVLVAICLLDLFFTGVYHLVKYGTIHKYGGQRALSEKSSTFHHTLRPCSHFDDFRWAGHIYSVSTNSLGFKDKAVRKVPLVPSCFRILFIGDSFTQGIGHEYDKTFVGLIEPYLARNDIEALNAGVVLYSPAIYLKKIEYLLSDVHLYFDHVVVFLDISDIHDEAKIYDIRDERVVWIAGGAPAVMAFLYEYTTIPRNILGLAVRLKDKLTDEPNADRSEEDKSYGINDYQSLWTVDSSVYSAYGEVGLQKAKRHMSLLAELLRKRRIGITLVVYPWPDQIVRNDLNSVQVKTWREWAAEHSAHFINLFPDFIKSQQAPKTVIRRYFIPGDIHWNEEGHRLVATRFVAQWQKLVNLSRMKHHDIGP